jgi:hypothetical protein
MTEILPGIVVGLLAVLQCIQAWRMHRLREEVDARLLKVDTAVAVLGDEIREMRARRRLGLEDR